MENAYKSNAYGSFASVYDTFMEDIPKAEDEKGVPVFGVSLVFESREGEEVPKEELLLRTWQRHYRLPWTIAETPRLMLRETIMEDLPRLLELYQEEEGNPDVKLFSQDPAGELEAYIRERYGFYGYGLWSVVEKSSGNLVGRVGLEEELSYLIGGKFRQKGYAKEAALAVLGYAAKELDLQEICLSTSLENKVSQRLAESIGFRRISEEDGRVKYRNPLGSS